MTTPKAAKLSPQQERVLLFLLRARRLRAEPDWHVRHRKAVLFRLSNVIPDEPRSRSRSSSLCRSVRLLIKRGLVEPLGRRTFTKYALTEAGAAVAEHLETVNVGSPSQR